jgi:hypothetical protein
MIDLHEKKLILVELNEINFELVKLYLKDSNLKNFSFILNEKTRTTISESDYSKLEPWIQWVSVHTGMNAKEHNISRLGETKNFNHEQIFEKIEDKNFNVGVLFAMNAINKTNNSAYFIPDPWTETKPNNSFWCKNIHKAVKQIVNDNSSKKIEIKSFLIILLACMRFIRLSKYQFFLKLFLNSFKKKWYKVLVLDFLISEIHINFIKNKKTNFSTVFYNAGAHIQHHYLQNIKKINSKLKNPSWYVSYDEDPFKDMLIMYDEILKSYINLINNGYNVIFATGLSQEPYDRIKFYYRLSDHKSFLKKLNIKFDYVQTLMTRDFFVFFDNNVDRDYAEKKLKEVITMDEDRIFGEIEAKDKCLFVTLTYPNEIKKDFEVTYNKQRINFYNEVNFVAIKNGMHSSKGYISYHGEIEKFQPKNNSHVKEIFNSINNFFN